MNTHSNENESNFFRAPFRRSLFSKISLAMKSWKARRSAIRQLRAMPEALLRDIGIERYQIENAVMGCSTRAEILPLRNESLNTQRLDREVQKAA